MKIKYYCEVCGKEYDTEAEALACEAAHKKMDLSAEYRSDCLEDMRDAIDSYLESALEDDLNFFDCLDALYHTLEDGLDTHKDKFAHKMDDMSEKDLWAYLKKGLDLVLDFDNKKDKKDGINLRDVLKPMTLKFDSVKKDNAAKGQVHGCYCKRDYDEFGNLVDEIIKDF